MMPGERWQQTQWLQTKVFVRGLPYSLTEEDVYTMFGKVRAFESILSIIMTV